MGPPSVVSRWSVAHRGTARPSHPPSAADGSAQGTSTPGRPGKTRPRVVRRYSVRDPAQRDHQNLFIDDEKSYEVILALLQTVLRKRGSAMLARRP